MDLTAILKYVNRDTVAQLVEEANDDPEDPEVILDGDTLLFTSR